MNIAVVDDEEIWSDKIREYICDFFAGTELQIDIFSSGEDFLKKGKDYQLVFMDIELPGMDGFSVLSEYRRKHLESLFIILTTHIEMSREGYKVEAFRYVDKFKIEEIDEALESAMLRMEKYRMIELPLKTLMVRKMQCIEIVYFEVYGHEVLLHDRNGEIHHCTETLKELSERMADKGFIFTNRSYLVNMEHIRKVENDCIYTTGNERLPLSRRKASDIRKKHFEWKLKRGNG